MKISRVTFFVTSLVNLVGLFSINIEPVRANPQKCYAAAIENINNYSSETANAIAFMCQGATSIVPGKCFDAAMFPGFTKEIAQRVAKLCKGATSTAPGACFKEMLPRRYTEASLERAFTLCKTPEPDRESDRTDREEPRGAWQLTMKGWTGILRMYGRQGIFVLVSTKNGVIIEQKMTLEKSPEYGYVLKGSIITATNRNVSADDLYIKQFSRESINIKDCDNRGCHEMVMNYLGE